MARLLVFSLIICSGCMAPRPDYRSIIACQLAVASLEKPPQEPEPEPVQRLRRGLFRRR